MHFKFACSTLSFMNTMTKTLWILLFSLAAVWGGAFVFNGMALQSFGTFTVVAGRLLIGGILLNIILFLSGKRYPHTWKMAINFLILGLLNNALPFSLIVWGQTRIAAGTASILNASTPLFTIILAHFFTQDEKLKTHRLIGVLLGISGVVILFGFDAFKGSGTDLLPRLAVLCAAISYAVAGIFSKRFSREGINPLMIASGQLIASAFITLPLALIIDQPWKISNPAPGSIIGIIGLGVLSTALAYIIYFYIVEKAGAGNALLVAMVIPFFALFLGNLILDENIEVRDLTALGILIFGLLIIDGRVLRVFGRKNRSGGDPPEPT